MAADRELSFRQRRHKKKEEKAARRGMKDAFKHLPSILPYLKNYWYLMILAIILTVISAAAAVAEPWPLAFLVDGVLGKEAIPGWIKDIFGSTTGTLIVVAVFSGVVIAFVINSTEVFKKYITTKLSEKMVLDFRSDLFEHVQGLSLAFHGMKRKGSLMYAVNTQANTMGEITIALLPLGEGFLRLAGMFLVAYRVDSQLALLSLTVVPFIYYSIGYYGRRIDPELRRVRGMESTSLSIVYEAMSMIKVIMAFGREDHEFGRFRRQGEKALDARLKLTVRQTAFSLAVNVIMAVGTAVVLWFGAQHVLDKQLSIGQLLIIMSYIAAVYKPLEQISTTIANLQEQLISLEAALDLINIQPDIVDPPDGVELGKTEGRLSFEGVNFSYAGRDETLSEINFDVPAGSRVALVGPTGAGKSTLVSLIPRFIDPTGGKVLIDGVDVKDIKLKSLRSQVSVVIQDAMLFSGTIYENIRYGRLDASRQEIIESAKAAGAHDFIHKLPQGYGTKLGEGGSQLSGGERQRVCIARAFLKDAPILILDEPTSSVDSKTESAILQALNRLMEGRTTFMIAHRLATIKSADHVIVVHEGRIAQQGTREELAAADGLYRELHAAQDLLEEAGVTADVDTAIQTAVSTQTPGTAAKTSVPAASRGPRKVVLLGMIGKMPVAGLVWQTIHYLIGLQKLGYQAYYVEAHARTPTMLWENQGDDATTLAAGAIEKVMNRIGLKDRWAYHALHDGERCFGMDRSRVSRLYREAELIINLHGGTMPTDEQAASGRLIYVETDPVERQIELFDKNKQTIEFLEPHAALFTYAENYGRNGCLLPLSPRFNFLPTRQPVILSSWEQADPPPAQLFTTVGNWKQNWRDITYRGKIYGWSKHHQFEKYLDLPARSGQEFELALASIDANDRGKLAWNRWRVRDAKWISGDLDAYRKFIRESRGEFTVAKEQNVAFHTGWFSDRSATYLAAGRPVVTEQTGFSDILPTGAGLFGFSSTDEALAALEAINSDYEKHSTAAREIAREHFSHEVVLGRLLDDLGLEAPTRPSRTRGAFPETIPLAPLSRRPLVLAGETSENAVASSLPAGLLKRPAQPKASVIVPVHGGLPLVRLCIDGVLRTPAGVPFELILVDNESPEETSAYLKKVAAANSGIRLITNESNRGFAGAVNQAMEQAAGSVAVFLNDDAVVTPGWLHGLWGKLEDPLLGAIAPVTNRSGDEAEIPAEYRTYGQMLDFAAARSREFRGKRRPAATLTMFCFAIRKATFNKVGPLDEQFAVGMFEDDDYCVALHEAGYRLATAEDVFVHHFGEASFGSLVPGGEYGKIFAENRRRFEAKHDTTWEPHSRRPDPAYEQTVAATRSLVESLVPAGDKVLVVSRGDDNLLQFDGRAAAHFPQGQDGSFPGHYPADSDEAIDHLEQLRSGGRSWLVVPRPAFWWKDHYTGFFRHLDSSYRRMASNDECLLFSLKTQEAGGEKAGVAVGAGK